MEFSQIKFDCSHFRNDIPCLPNKEHGVQCDNCNHYSPIETRILIIKLGALGDVVRTTPIISALRKKYTNSKITWLTHSPDILERKSIDTILTYSGEQLFTLAKQSFDLVINLDKDKEACILSNEIKADKKLGYGFENNHIIGYNKAAEQKIITGLFDSISKANTKDYVTEIFDICELNYQDEKYGINQSKALKEKMQIEVMQVASLPNSEKPVIGLNTGCGKRWKTRLWPVSYWEDLIRQLHTQGYRVILLGGEEEHDKNQLIALSTGAGYRNFYSLPEFIALCSNVQLIVTQVSMAMHLALAVQTKIVLMNNIFNKNEFNLMQLGEIVEPKTGCDCYFGTQCCRKTSCMYDLSVEQVVQAIERVV